MRLALVHARAETLELARYPSFVVPTLLFPALFFLLFAVPGARPFQADLLLASYAGFAFLGVAFFQFGVGIAAERASPWDAFVRSLPLRARTRLAGRVLSALLFATASGSVVVAVALATTPASLSAQEWIVLAWALVAGTIPFALLGIALGYLTSPKAALPIANVLYLVLAYLGSLWVRPGHLPPVVASVSPALPTRQWADVLRAAAIGDALPSTQVLALVGWTVAFGLLAAWAYRRDEGERYR